MKTYQFTVTGRGAFPLDMLRYDCCYPAHPEDVAAMDYDNTTREGIRAQRTVKLRGLGMPEMSRWNSFGWSVSDTKEVR